MERLTENQVWEKMQDLCKELNWEWEMSRRVSDHPEDWYLHYAVIKNHKGEYVSYIYNATLGENGSFNCGHYFDNVKDAMEHCENR